MSWRGEVEDGSGWGGLVPSKAERDQDRRDENQAHALDYYRAAVEDRAPAWVPSRIRLPRAVRGDFPFGHNTVAEAGEHDCDSNLWGAVSVRATNGQMLGIKPKEFQPIAWRPNSRPTTSTENGSGS